MPKPVSLSWVVSFFTMFLPLLKTRRKNKRAKMALDRSPDFLRLLLPFFFVAFREEFTRISLCLYSARSLHSLIPCLLTDQNFKNNSEKGHSRKISMRLFQNLTNSFQRRFFMILFMFI